MRLCGDLPDPGPEKLETTEGVDSEEVDFLDFVEPDLLFFTNHVEDSD